MKRIKITLIALLAVAMVGCGKVDEQLITTDSNNQSATQIEEQTGKKTDVSKNITTAVEKNTITDHQSTETSVETKVDNSTLETLVENNDVNANSENSETLQSQAEEKQSVTETYKHVTTTVGTTEVNTTQAETTSISAVADNRQTADVFKMLDSLNYHAISCDGIPTHKLTVTDGTVYLINFDGGWVWRRPSLIADADNEAPLTQEVIDAIYANWDKLNIIEYHRTF